MPQHVDPILEKYMQQQRMQQFWRMVSQVGQGILTANRQGQSPMRTLAAGMAQGMQGRSGGGGGGGLIPMLREQEYLTKARREQRQYDARDMLVSGMLDVARQPAMRRYDESGALLPSGVGAPSDLSPGRGLLDRAKPGLLGRAYPEAMGRAMVAEMFPKEPKYGVPVTVQGPKGPELVRFPQGSGAPVQVEGYGPYTKPGEGPALVQIAAAYRRAMEQAGKPVSELKSLQWAKTSVGRSPKDIWVSVYTAALRGMADPEDAKSTADEITAYVTSLQTGGAQQPPAGGSMGLSPAGPAQAATRPGAAPRPLASVTPIPGGLGPGEQPPYPWRKPSGRGVKLPLRAAGGNGRKGKPIETMTKDEVVALIYGGRELSQDEIDRLDARLEALGVPRP